MSITHALLTELKREKDNTLRILNNLTNDVFGWKPHEKSMSVGHLANHIVELHNWIELVVSKDTLNFEEDYNPSALVTKEGLIELLESGYLRNKNLLEEMNPSVYFETWKLKSGDHVIAEMPKAAAIRYIVTNHLIHHRGQLTVYLRMLDLPVPGLYGPSADDKTMC